MWCLCAAQSVVWKPWVMSNLSATQPVVHVNALRELPGNHAFAEVA